MTLIGKDTGYADGLFSRPDRSFSGRNRKSGFQPRSDRQGAFRALIKPARRAAVMVEADDRYIFELIGVTWCSVRR